MNEQDVPCDKETLDRLMSHGVFLSDTAGKLSKKQVLIFIGEVIFSKFVNEFSQLWQELFADCQIKDYEATEEDWRYWLGDDYHNSKNCKEVDKYGK